MNARLSFLAAAALLTVTPPAADAQFIGGIANPLGGFPFSNPYLSYNRFATRGFTFRAPGGGVVSASRVYSGSTTGYYRFYNRLPYSYYATYRNYVPPAGGSSGGAGMPFKPPAINQAMIGNAQLQAQRNEMEPRKQVFDQWAFEKIGGAALKDLAVKDAPPELQKALLANTEADVVSGEVLNHILVASFAMEKNGAKAAGVTLPPELLSQVAFGGSPSAEALNTLRQAGKLPFPPLFDNDKMRVVKEDLENDFAAVATSASTGKAVDQNKVARLADDVQRARDRVAPVSRNLPFEDALAARRFLNDIDGVVKLFRDGAMAGIVNPRWNTEGTTVSDLVHHMAKYKLLFGPAPKDGAAAEAYVALQKGLAAYHAALNQPAKK